MAGRIPYLEGEKIINNHRKGGRLNVLDRLCYAAFFYLLIIAVFVASDDLAEANEIVESSHEIKIFAHRGASGYAPENTFSAFDKALALNSDFIELDVQLSKDGKLVVIHDQTVDRTTNGSGRVHDLTFDQLKDLDAGSWFSKNFKGEKIPSLEQVFNRYEGRIGFLIEFKYPDINKGIEKKLAEFLKRRGSHKPINEEIIVQSFERDSLKMFKRYVPNIPVGLLLPLDFKTIDTNKIKKYAKDITYLNLNAFMLDKDIVKTSNQYGMKTLVWTVSNNSMLNSASQLGVNGVVTDYPDLFNRLSLSQIQEKKVNMSDGKIQKLLDNVFTAARILNDADISLILPLLKEMQNFFANDQVD